MYRLLDDHEVAHAVQALNQSQPDRWRAHDRALHAQWVFGSFMDAMAFMHQVAQIAEAMNHHPGIGRCVRPGHGAFDHP